MDYKKLFYSMVTAGLLLCCQQASAYVGYYRSNLSAEGLAATAASSAAIGLGGGFGATVGHAMGLAFINGVKAVFKGAWWMVRSTAKGTYSLGKKAVHKIKGTDKEKPTATSPPKAEVTAKDQPAPATPATPAATTAPAG